MMFLFRCAFWLLILVLLIPTDKDQQNQIYGTAQAAVKDLAGFCERNPQTCAMGQDAFAVLVQKAQYGAEMVMTLVDDQTSGEPPANRSNRVAMPDERAIVPNQGAVMPVPSAVPLEMYGVDRSQDTLNPDDRNAAWGGSDV